MEARRPKVENNTILHIITSIWVVPFIAIIIAIWLIYQYFSQLGPKITITFDKNQGLIAGQSVVKFRNVPIGKVKKIRISKDSKGVEVVVQMDKESEAYMTKNAKFWIVKPEVGVSGISGLDTLISGTYINLFSKKEGKIQTNFIGLSSAYRTTEGGKYFNLTSSNTDNISVGTPLYYKSIKIGQVEYINLGLDNKSMNITIFIKQEYLLFIHKKSKFWIKDTLNIDFSKGSLAINLAPLRYILQGGIILSSSINVNKNLQEKVDTQHIFYLYKNRDQAQNRKFFIDNKIMKKFILNTKSSIANIKIGSPVRYEQFNIGSVLDINLSYHRKSHKILGKVLIEIDTTIFKDPRYMNLSGENNLYRAVKDGLRAKISPLDPITNMLFIDLVFHHKNKNKIIKNRTNYPIFPIITNRDKTLMDGVNNFMDKLNNLKIEEILVSMDKLVNRGQKPIDTLDQLLKDLRISAKNINKLTNKKSFQILPDEINRLIEETRTTLKSTKKVIKGYDSNSIVKYQISQTLEVLTKTSKEMQVFLKMLNRKPDSLIFGDY